MAAAALPGENVDLNGKRILIVKPSSLGDVVHTLPLVHALKRCHPACFIGWIVQRAFSPIIESDSAVDEVIPISIPSTSDPAAGWGAVPRSLAATVSTLRELRRKFRREPYDVVVDLHASFRSGLLGLSNPRGLRIGFSHAKELNPLFQHRRVEVDPSTPHAVDHNLALARYLGCPPEPVDFRIEIGGEAREGMRLFLSRSGVSDSDRVVYANPAARWTTKFWTVEAWAELADKLAELRDVKTIFCGSPQDLDYIEAITARTKNRPIVGAGKLGLAQAVALAEAADVYVGVDSGPMHIAAMAGTRVVALFGPTDPEKVGPYGEGHIVLRNNRLGCLACRKRSCSDRRCLEGISASTVYDAVSVILAGFSTSAADKPSSPNQ